MTQFKSQNEFWQNECWHFTGSQRASDSHDAPAMAQTAPLEAPMLPDLQIHTELLGKGKLWDFVEGTAGLLCHENTKVICDESTQICISPSKG